MECRGTEKRQWIVNNYDVKPVAHIQLLSGQTKQSDAGATIENDYYIFNAVHKQNGSKEVIQCGMGAARDFLRLLEHNGLELFNPLHVERESGEILHRDGVRRRNAWNPIAKQLYNAIMWVIIIIDAVPNTTIYNIREKVYKYYDREPFFSQVKSVNTIIKRTMKGTLTEEIDKFRESNDLKDDICQFDMLINIINNRIDNDETLLKSYF